MHRASSWGRIECLKILAEKGASLHSKNMKGETPRDIARRYGHTACYDYLARAGLSIRKSKYYHGYNIIFINYINYTMLLNSIIAVRRNYKNKIQAYNDTLTDHDLISGKLNKDDRVRLFEITRQPFISNYKLATISKKCIYFKTIYTIVRFLNTRFDIYFCYAIDCS